MSFFFAIERDEMEQEVWFVEREYAMCVKVPFLTLLASWLDR